MSEYGRSVGRASKSSRTAPALVTTSAMVSLALLGALFALAAPRSSATARTSVSPGRAAAATGTAGVSAAVLERYAVGLAKAWEAETEADGVVRDPLIPAGSPPSTDGSARFMIIMMADAMLRLSALENVPSLAGTAERILSETVSLPASSDPFNLLAIASLIRDGQRGLLPEAVWQRMASPVIRLAGQITFPTAHEQECSHQVECYDNHRLVWAAGASILLSDQLPEDGIPGTLLGEPARVSSRIGYDLETAWVNASPPTTASDGDTMREVSDPGEEPSAYHILSTWMLSTVVQYSPASMTSALEGLRGEAESYALAMMAPDGQLSLAGRSLDQSWVQAAAASLGADLARPSDGGPWGEFATRALEYLMGHYPTHGGGTLAIVPGLSLDWNPSLVDGYAEYNQFNGLTLWFLVEALSDWSNVADSSAPTGAPPPMARDAAPPHQRQTVRDVPAARGWESARRRPGLERARLGTFAARLVDGQRANDRPGPPQRTGARRRKGAGTPRLGGPAVAAADPNASAVERLEAELRRRPGEPRLHDRDGQRWQARAARVLPPPRASAHPRHVGARGHGRRAENRDVARVRAAGRRRSGERDAGPLGRERRSDRRRQRRAQAPLGARGRGSALHPHGHHLDAHAPPEDGHRRHADLPRALRRLGLREGLSGRAAMAARARGHERATLALGS